MSDVHNKRNTRNPPRRQRSIYQVHYSLRPREDEIMPKSWPNSDGLELKEYKLQVAGHRDALPNKKYIGLLQCSNGRILKPILKEAQRQEVNFYTRLAATVDSDLLELRTFTPKYYGCKKFAYNGFEQEYIILEDLTERMLEPCIMDIKIGRITWDHLATPEKIDRETNKYKLCKEEFGFCIPGYQVFKVDTGTLQKYNKDYGKKLHGQMVRTALRNFLNGVGVPLCRALVVRLLSALWRLQRWAARARSLRLRTASLLLVYDAARLHRTPARGPRHGTPPLETQNCHRPSIARSKSFHSMHNPASGSNFSGQISSKGPVYRKVSSVPLTPLTVVQDTFSTPPPIKSLWSDALMKLDENHSFDNNYDDKLCKIKMDYRATLEQLASDAPTPIPWGTVKVIDFAHAHFHDDEEPSVDENFKEGIDNLVKIFETLLRETENQIS